MPYEEHQVRVIDERAELVEKITKLQYFLAREDLPTIVPDKLEIERLRCQLYHMQAYRSVLDDRIENFVQC